MSRKFIFAAAILLLGIAAGFYWFTRPLPALTIATAPGALGRAQTEAQLSPFASAKHVDVRAVPPDGGLDTLVKTEAQHAYPADVINLALPDAIQACQRGLLEKFDSASLPPGDDGTPPANDFARGAIGPCWVGNALHSQAVIFADFHGPQPKTLADFFDVAKFPGSRALRHEPKFNLEMALLADGLPPEDIYMALSTRLGMEHALKKLESLGPIVWWQDASQPIALIRDGRAVMATADGAAIYEHQMTNVIWDRQVYDLDVFAVPAGDPRKDLAMDFIRFATGSAPLAARADLAPDGPTRHSSLALLDKSTGTVTKNWLPTTHFNTAFAIDEAWWQIHGTAVMARWQAWVQSH